MDKIRIDEFTRYSFLSKLKFSPDGKKLCFVVKKAGGNRKDYISRLWIYDLQRENLFRLTSGKNDRDFVWEDRENIIFFTNRKKENQETGGEGKTDIYRINVTGGEGRYIASLPFKVKDVKITGSTLVVSALVNKENFLGNKNDEDEKDYQVFHEIPFWSDADGLTNNKRTHLFTYNLAKQELKEITPGDYQVEDFDVLGDQICINMKTFKDKMDLYSNLFLYNLQTGEMTRLTEHKMMTGFVHFLDKDNVIYSATDMKAMGVNTNKDIYQINLRDRTVRRRTENLNKSFWISVGTDCRLGSGITSKVEKGKLYFLTTEDHNSYLNILGDNGVRRIIGAEGSVDMFDVFDGKIAFIGFRGNKLQELYIFEQGEERVITGFNEGVLKNKKLSHPEYFEVVTPDGCKLDAWIMKPVDFEPGRKYPAILEIHGGPKTVYGTVFFHEMQLLAANGYVVIYSNPRGSDGRGHEFADIRGKYGTVDYEDLMVVLDTAIDKFSFIDEECLGVAGGSYGGFMTNWIIGHTNRFKAAVSQGSISNWISKFCTTDIGYFFVKDQFAGATPWENFDKLWEGSPLKYADRVSTPTLFIHSEEDYRCCLTEGIQMFTALKYHGVDSRICIFKGETHELSRSGKLHHRIRRLREILDWFNKYLQD